MPGESGVTVVTMLVCFIYFAREAAGALSARHSPRPLFFLGERFMHNSGASRRGNVESCREYERATLPVVIARLDRATRYSRDAVTESRSRGVLDTPLARGMTTVTGRSKATKQSRLAPAPCDGT